MSITLASVAAFSAAVRQARAVDFSAYTLRAGATRDALIDAARAGATVRVRLERAPFDDAAGTLQSANAESITALRAVGADAATRAQDQPVLHMKAAVVDGVAWLDDRNWAGDTAETVLRDSDPDDVAAVTTALQGQDGADPHLRTTKGAALNLEVDMIRTAGSAPLAVESESFGSGSVYSALLRRGSAGLPTRLLVAGRESAEPGPRGATESRRLERLAALGVEIRTGIAGGVDFDEKIATTPESAWVGSANATYARAEAGQQRDWGLFTRQAPLVDGLRSAFERNWSQAQPFHRATVDGRPCVKPSATTSGTRPPAPNYAPRSISASTSR